MIDKSKTYKDSDGEVRILCIDSGIEDYPVVGVANGAVHTYTADGRFFSDRQSSTYDLTETTPYDFPTDAKGLAWNDSHETKYKRYFDEVGEDGRPKLWAGGATSWSASHSVAWDHFELITE